MQDWLLSLYNEGIHCGPIFPFMWSNDTTTDQPVQNMKTHQYTRWISLLFEYVGGAMADCTSHSIRRSAAMWAARCGVRQYEIQMGGRWCIKTTSFILYVNDGVNEATKIRMRTGVLVDPVRAFWVWVPTVIDQTG
jgi:integrase